MVHMFRRASPVFLTCFALVLSAGIARALPQEEIVNLTDWTIAGVGARFDTAGNVLRVSGGRGWLRTRTVFVDFTLRLDYRITQKDSEAGVLVRTSITRSNSWPVSGYRISVREKLTGLDRTGAITSYDGKIRRSSSGTVEAQPGVSAQGDWQRLEIRCEGDRTTVILNGTIVDAVEGTEWLAGYIGIEGVRGDIEFRNIALTRPLTGVLCGNDRITGATEVPLVSAAGIVPPRVRQEVKPRYTTEAMQRKVQGAVLLEVVVETDGSVGAACVRRGLDQDLDAEAFAAVKRWLFEPATRDSQPVAVLATISLTFTLRQ
jgi:TonB family protein